VQKLLPDVKVFSDCFTFQQDSLPTRRLKELVHLFKRETPQQTSSHRRVASE